MGTGEPDRTVPAGNWMVLYISLDLFFLLTEIGAVDIIDELGGFKQ
jgi:hypothetical protein